MVRKKKRHRRSVRHCRDAIVRELHGVMASMRVAEGILKTTTSFSDDAKEYAKSNHIDLMDWSAVLRSILTLTKGQKESFLQLATAGDYTMIGVGVRPKSRRTLL